MIKSNKEIPFTADGGIHSDERGELRFFNGFKFDDIKRFYIISHPSVETVRAWHGHKYEKKYFFVLRGSFQINSIEIDDWTTPSVDLVPFCFKLSYDEPKILCVPSGFANGLKALEPNSSVMVFSNFSLDDSLNDDYRFDPTLWYDWANQLPLHTK
jgi:dTDP-4-dehydrorhamnose 3,5-epimerase-like enzyme